MVNWSRPQSPSHNIMPRTLFKVISENVTHWKELSSYEREILIKQASQEVTPVSLTKITKVPQITIIFTLFQADIRLTGVSKPWSERLKLLSVRDCRHITRIARLTPEISYQEIQEKTELACSRKTVYRVLKDYGLTNWLAKKRPKLSPAVAGKRLEWALTHKDWTYEDWIKVIWSDECSVERGSGKQRKWVFCLPQEKWNKNIIHEAKKGQDISVMVWAAFWEAEQSELYELKQNFEIKKQSYSANFYIQILKNNLLGIWESDFIFMQNNTLIHSAHRVCDWFTEISIEVMN